MKPTLLLEIIQLLLESVLGSNFYTLITYLKLFLQPCYRTFGPFQSDM